MTLRPSCVIDITLFRASHAWWSYHTQAWGISISVYSYEGVSRALNKINDYYLYAFLVCV